MDARDLFLREHARAHSSAMSGDVDMPFTDFIFGLGDEQMRQCPPGTNSLAWILWHMARSEDMGVNLVVAGRPQVIETGDWMAKLGLSRVDIGTGMSDDEVSDFTSSVDIAVIREYRDAVGRRTREAVAALAPDEWLQPIDTALLARAFDEGAIGSGGAWLRGFIDGKTKEFLLAHVSVRHNFMHIGEAMTVRSFAGQPLGV